MARKSGNNSAEPEAPYCRLCLSNWPNWGSNYIRNIFPLTNSTAILVGIIEALTNIKILEGDPYSKIICPDCWDKLIAIKNFKFIIERSDSSLRNDLELIIRNVVKPKGDNKTRKSRLLNNNEKKQVEGPNFDETKVKEELVEADLRAGPSKIAIKFESGTGEENCSDFTIENENITNSFESIRNGGSRSYYEEMDSNDLKIDIKTEIISDNEDLAEDKLQNESYGCEICHKNFSDETSLFSHKLSHDELTGYKCPICSKVYLLKGFFDKHLKSHPVIKEKPPSNRCTQCLKAFETKPQLTTHIRKYHPRAPEMCDICGKIVADLKRHRKNHTKPYKCNICNISYGQKSTLDAHVNKHTKEKTFQCDICFKVLGSRKTLFYHKRAIHSELRRFKCDLCEKQFHFKQSLQGHVRNIHIKTSG